MRSQNLYVEPSRSAGAKVIDQMQQRELGCVGLFVEHRFSAEYAARVHAVDAADKFTVLAPCLDAVRQPVAVQLGVNADKIGGDPRAFFMAARDLRTLFDHAMESVIDGE